MMLPVGLAWSGCTSYNPNQGRIFNWIGGVSPTRTAWAGTGVGLSWHTGCT